MLQDFINRWKERKSKSKDIEDDLRIHERIVEKKKSANERELESYLEEVRQKNIKNQVEQFRQQKRNEHWHSPTAIDTPNMFKKKSNSLLNQPSLLRGSNMFLR